MHPLLLASLCLLALPFLLWLLLAVFNCLVNRRSRAPAFRQWRPHWAGPPPLLPREYERSRSARARARARARWLQIRRP